MDRYKEKERNKRNKPLERFTAATKEREKKKTEEGRRAVRQ